MPRIALVLLVATLSVSASGLSSLLVQEPCEIGETGDLDTTCPPSCVTCGCCHRSVDVARIELAETQVQVVAEPPTIREQLRTADPREILHVPKLVVA